MADSSVFNDRLKSKESVILGHSIKKVSQKCVQFLHDCSQPSNDKSMKQASCSSAILTLNNYAIEIDKAEQVSKSCIEQINDYVVLESKVSSLVESTSKDIEKLNEELRLAKKVRQHKEQYEALAKIVNKHPSKTNTKMEQNKIKLDINRLEDEKNDLDKQINIREKQFTLLMTTIDDLTKTLNEDPFDKNKDEKEEGEEEDDDDVDENLKRDKRARGDDMEEGEEEGEEETFKRSKGSVVSIASSTEATM